MLKNILVLLILVPFLASSQHDSGAQVFWNTLQAHCGKAYEGIIVEGKSPGNAFENKKLVMHVRSCSANQIKIPFMVGDDRSRTWIFTLEGERITLKHDHRHADGTPDKTTMYGGTSTNGGSATLQVFPADKQTIDILPTAFSNVWWISLSDKTFTYNLNRIGSDRVVSIEFNVTNEIAQPEAPWGWKPD
jgi:hypothetical protein